jgi:beta-lactamase regulating signal transducer with metallopeptidase domain
MSGSSLLLLLVQLTLVSSAAVVLVGTLRGPVRRLAGARAAYWLWVAVPACALGVLLPAPSAPMLANPLLSPVASGVPDALVSITATGASGNYVVALLAVWIAGAFLMATWLVRRQRTFLSSLGQLTANADGTFRSARIEAPMLVGAWRPRVIVPTDFETRYSEPDRLLMLAHERAHQERGDTRVNSLAAAWLCLSWFNPLMHWAWGRMRFDQELACDALVLSRWQADKKRYANALLAAQLNSESGRHVPAGCHWQSTHPLKARIAMLKLPAASSPRRLAGIVFAVALAAAGMYSVSSSFAQAPAQAADKKFAIDAKEMDTRKVLEMIAQKGEHNILVSDKVGGKITVHLVDVTWREALEIVAQSQGLVTRQSGNITFVDLAP